jgi:hypothetical protein
VFDDLDGHEAAEAAVRLPLEKPQRVVPLDVEPARAAQVHHGVVECRRRVP